jgi:hypothetical protein
MEESNAFRADQAAGTGDDDEAHARIQSKRSAWRAAWAHSWEECPKASEPLEGFGE